MYTDSHLPFSRPGLPLRLSFDQADVLRDSGISRLRVALSDAMAWNERSYGNSHVKLPEGKGNYGELVAKKRWKPWNIKVCL